MQILQDNNLFLKLSKCDFRTNETEFCSTKFTSNGISLDESKLDALFASRLPKNTKDVQSFLGICNWFRDFIPKFSDIAEPLTALTKKSSTWQWTELEQGSIILLLHRIATAPCLRYYNPKLDTVAYSDASQFGIGGWIGQVHPDGIHPTIFWSRKLQPAELKYPVHERELLALVKLCTKNRAILIGQPFKIHTDHRALVFLQTEPVLSPRQARWLEKPTGVTSVS
jgi:hypothetical protein